MNINQSDDLDTNMVLDNLNGPIDELVKEPNCVYSNLFKDIYQAWIKHLDVYAKEPCPFKDVTNIWTSDNSKLYDTMKSFFDNHPIFKDSLYSSSYLPSSELFEKMLHCDPSDVQWLKSYNTLFISTLQKKTTEFDKKTLTPRKPRGPGHPKELVPTSEYQKAMLLQAIQNETKFLNKKNIEIKTLEDVKKNLTDELNKCKEELKEAKDSYNDECRRLSNEHGNTVNKFNTLIQDFESQLRDMESQNSELRKRCSDYDVRCNFFEQRNKRLRSELSQSVHVPSVSV